MGLVHVSWFTCTSERTSLTGYRHGSLQENAFEVKFTKYLHLYPLKWVNLDQSKQEMFGDLPPQGLFFHSPRLHTYIHFRVLAFWSSAASQLGHFVLAYPLKRAPVMALSYRSHRNCSPENQRGKCQNPQVQISDGYVFIALHISPLLLGSPRVSCTHNKSDVCARAVCVNYRGTNKG